MGWYQDANLARARKEWLAELDNSLEMAALEEEELLDRELWTTKGNKRVKLSEMTEKEIFEGMETASLYFNPFMEVWLAMFKVELIEREIKNDIDTQNESTEVDAEGCG